VNGCFAEISAISGHGKAKIKRKGIMTNKKGPEIKGVGSHFERWTGSPRKADIA
jgi:hypothetical protein